jgi:hypothetical protein
VRARWPAALVACSLLSTSLPAWACACGVSGPDSSLTTRLDRFGIGLSERLDLGLGTYDVGGAHHEFDSGEKATRLTLALLAAFRPVKRLELGLRTAYGRSSTSTGAVRTVSSGALEPLATVRFEAIDQAMSWDPEGFPLSLTGTAGVLTPVPGAREKTAENLGAWELSLGALAERALTPRARIGLSTEGAVRLPDESLGFPRQLGPRFSTQLTASYLVAPTLVVGALSRLSWEGDVIVKGDRKLGTGARIGDVGTSAAFRGIGSSFRPAAVARWTPPLSGISANTRSALSVELTVAYTR